MRNQVPETHRSRDREVESSASADAATGSNFAIARVGGRP
ncbi:MAG: hypothetical protein QOF13_1486 [Solirubrobacterales bacterium]|jgi:hypothetical protein|nr:hypothetical protein [Solirubrobacterales bacterium]